MMENVPRHSIQYRFDAFCKTVLRNEAVNYRRMMKQQYEREIPFSELSLSELGKICTTDCHPSDYYTFSSHGCELCIENEQVAEVFAKLAKTEQSILILRFVMEMTDREIGLLLGMSRGAVQRHRTSTLKMMRYKLRTLLPKGG